MCTRFHEVTLENRLSTALYRKSTPFWLEYSTSKVQALKNQSSTVRYKYTDIFSPWVQYEYKYEYFILLSHEKVHKKYDYIGILYFIF